MNPQESIIRILKSIGKTVSNKLHCDRHGSCVHFAEIFVEEVNEQYPELLNDFDVIEGYVNVKFGNGIPQEHTWIRLKNGDIIDPTFLQFNKYDSNADYSKKRTKVYSGQEYYDEGKEGSWFSQRRKEFPSSIFKEGKRKYIRNILREGGYIPSPIMRRISNDDLEEAFDYALETNATSMDNTNSVIFKEKKPSLWVFSKFVIDDMVTILEQEYFNDDNRIYFSDTDEDDKTYHEKIRQPLLRHYGKRIKEKYYEVMSSNDEEIIQESIRRILREDSLKNDLMGLINNVGVKKASKAVGGFKNLFRILNINSPMDYLHLFDDLKIVPISETEFRDGFFNESEVDCYGYSPDEIIFIHFKDYGGEGRISYEEIWGILREEFGLSHEETVELTMEWLNSVFDLQVRNTFDDGY